MPPIADRGGRPRISALFRIRDHRRVRPGARLRAVGPR
jgi:hypothetical protein